MRTDEGKQHAALLPVTTLCNRRVSDVQVGGWIYAKLKLPISMVYCGTVAKYRVLKWYAEQLVRETDGRLDVLAQQLHTVELSRSKSKLLR